jgi:hypothetical protein
MGSLSSQSCDNTTLNSYRLTKLSLYSGKLIILCRKGRHKYEKPQNYLSDGKPIKLYTTVNCEPGVHKTVIVAMSLLNIDSAKETKKLK